MISRNTLFSKTKHIWVSRAKFLVIVVLLGLVLMLTACGQSKKAATIHVELLDVQFRPDKFTVPAGAEVTFTATNYGLAPHNFIIFKKGLDAGEHFGHEDEVNIYWRLDVPPGNTVTETFIAPMEPGEYYVACGVHSHLEDGMVAKLIVK